MVFLKQTLKDTDVLERQKDFLLGIIFLLISIVLIFFIIPSQAGSFGRAQAQVPFAGAIALGLLALYMLARNWPQKNQPEGFHWPGLSRFMRLQTALCCLVMVALAFAAPWFGLLVSSAAGLLVLLYCCGVRRPPALLITTFLLIAFIYIAFEMLLGIALPKGLFFE